MKNLICLLFHKIEILNSNLFTDIVSGKTVGEFKCPKCDKTFMANSKKSFFRVFR